jgi:protein-S-isoprenylcysteine O-methyltransferase Ste14
MITITIHDYLRSVLAIILFTTCVLAGFGSVKLFFQELPRTIFFCISVVALAFFSAGRGGINKGKEQGESRTLFLLLMTLTLLAAFCIPFFAGRNLTSLKLPDFFRYLGIGLFVCGLIIRRIAIRTLKRQFSIFVAIQENHQLITTGIYSQIRHPIYLGALLSLIGFVLVFPTLLGFIFVVIYSMLLTHRMAQEERLMMKHFGSVYEEYISKSYRLIPHIY